MIPRLAGDYRAAVPSGMRIYRARIPGTDRELLRAVQRSGADVKVMTVNPFRVVWNWLALGRKGLHLPVRRRRRVYAYATMIAAVRSRGAASCAGVGAAGCRRRRGLRRGVDGSGRSGSGHGAQRPSGLLHTGMAGRFADALSAG